MKTPTVACIAYGGYGIIWSEDNMFALLLSNNLEIAGLGNCFSLHPAENPDGFSFSGLFDVAQWTYLRCLDFDIFVHYHRVLKRSQVKLIGETLQKTIKEYEKNYYRVDQRIG